MAKSRRVGVVANNIWRSQGAGALGLLAGIRVPLIGIAPRIGLVLFFIAAIITHLPRFVLLFRSAIVFLLLGLASLVLRVASL